MRPDRLKWSVTNPTAKVPVNSETGRIDLEDIESSTGRLVTSEEDRRERDGEGVHFQPGDVLFGKLRPYLRKSVLCASEGCCSPELLVLRPLPGKLDSRYLHYLALSDPFADWTAANSWGAKMPRTDSEAVRDFRPALPSVEGQREVVEFLDGECGQIDELLDTKREFQTLLREKMRAVGSEYALRGTKTTPMKPSGLPTVGDIPAHWTVRQNKTFTRELAELSTTGEEELLTVSHITGVTSRREKDVTMFMAESLVGYKLCEPGDLAVNTMWAWMGALGIARQEGVVSPAYGVYRFDPEQAMPDYFDLLFRSPGYVAEMTRYSRGIRPSRLRLYPESFLSLRSPVPPLEEQRAIVEAAAEAKKPIETVLATVERSISLLTERRRALVTAAITGAIEPSSYRANRERSAV